MSVSPYQEQTCMVVSMKSGLEGRNNQYIAGTSGQWGDKSQ